MSEEGKRALSINIRFPKTPEKEEERMNLFEKMQSLIEKEKEALSAKIQILEKSIIGTTDVFFFGISFGKEISVMVTSKNPKENIETANDFANKTLNYVNVILGDYATESQITSMLDVLIEEKSNVARKIIGEPKLAKINEIARKTLDPLGIIFEFESDNRSNLLVPFYHEDKHSVAIFSIFSLEEKLPWDIMKNEYTYLFESTKVISELARKEF